jgi:aspartate ammonia-lyase
VVRDFSDLVEKVIPFFDKKLFIKRKNFEKFKKVLEIVKEGKHLSKEGLAQILDLAYSMNTQKRKFSKEYILNTYKA